MSLVINSVAETKIQALQDIEITEARVRTPSPDRVTIWHRRQAVTDMSTLHGGHEVDLTLTLNFNATTLKYSILIN